MYSNLNKVLQEILRTKGSKVGKKNPVFLSTMLLLRTNEEERKQDLAYFSSCRRKGVSDHNQPGGCFCSPRFSGHVPILQ